MILFRTTAIRVGTEKKTPREQSRSGKKIERYAAAEPTGAAYAFVASGLTQAAIGSCSTSTSRVPNLLTGTVEDFEIQQPKWAGATGVVGESVIPTAIDIYCSLNQKSELR